VAKVGEQVRSKLTTRRMGPCVPPSLKLRRSYQPSPGEALAETGRRDDIGNYFPGHTGLRFSAKAFRPSLASSVIASSAIWVSV
jgi:hypothetical protein